MSAREEVLKMEPDTILRSNERWFVITLRGDLIGASENENQAWTDALRVLKRRRNIQCAS